MLVLRNLWNRNELKQWKYILATHDGEAAEPKKDVNYS